MPGPTGDVSDASSLDPEALGFMCGLEIHQQLATGKLHSRQAGELHDVTSKNLPDDWQRVARRLRAASGEGGKIDVAARFESRRRRSFIYVQAPNSGLIELDDAPPLSHDEDAVDISLTMAAMLDMKPVELFQAMRKTVVDGSNTSGFQRTTLIATDGILPVEGGDVGIDVLCLEEDSARKLDTIESPEGEKVLWNLDRLGIPLVEIATAPDVRTPEHAKDTAVSLGGLLRDTRRVRRGLGSIRQDLNVSLACGDRVEIKGCQDLSWIPRIIRLEMARQLHLYRLACELREEMGLPALPDDRRNTDSAEENRVAEAVAAEIPMDIQDVSKVFESSTSKMVSSSLENGGLMLCVVLPRLAGRLGVRTLDSEGAQMPRLGRELAGAARLAGVKGIFHSDELPAYGITEQEVEKVRHELSISDADAFALCIAPEWQGRLALESVINRARLAWHRIPQEVRNVVVKKGSPEDGTTSPMRPLPGGARMYPETDVPSHGLDAVRWQRIISNLPPSREQRMARLIETDLSEDQAQQILSRELDDEIIAAVSGGFGLPPVSGRMVANLILASMGDLPTALICAMVHLRESGGLARDAEDALGRDLLEGGAWTDDPDDMIAFLDIAAQRAVKLGLQPADSSELRGIIEEVVNSRLDFVKERGLGAVGPLMGMVMGKAKGADGKEVSTILREIIQGHL